ncbi:MULTISPECIES: glycerate kinase [unclassified Meiothermus]|uniref:glycerate kinase type-2 family protein n=1 Tax=unclassified Meiothermus TaxID=370471 RepID=UPI000D7BDA10|nr:MULTISPECIES: glycerate kinase [unclassified Meiothermus]PZA08990.1 glycerate kinase [Meiothermus sp. Pnk-1]RYM40876.1 glycerate kinase [Meiothermus sp. PNK-Is4]
MRALLEASFRHALAATHPTDLTRAALPEERPALILAVGKAALTMLEACVSPRGGSERYPGVPYLATPKADPALKPSNSGAILPAAHPIPDERSVRAAERALELASRLRPQDLLLVLVSGGGSALWCLPEGISLAEKQALNQALLRSGASIQEINAVRKHLSRIKGGGLVRATQARVLALLLSDVPGDDPAVIASGPTVPDPTTFAEALEVLERYRIEAPAARAHLERGLRGEIPETLKPGDPAFARVENRLVGGNQTFLEAARAYWEARGYRTLLLSDRFGGEARELAGFHAALVQSIRTHGTPVRPPVVLLSGGEATVTVRGGGRGGRNQEFLLGLLQRLGPEGVWALAADTDGLDGNTEAAGAFLAPDSWSRAQAQGLSLKAYLERNDAYGFFSRLGDLLVTGPTQNNLNDYRVIVLE